MWTELSLLHDWKQKTKNVTARCNKDDTESFTDSAKLLGHTRLTDRKNVPCIMQYVFSSSILQLSELAKGKVRVILFKWLGKNRGRSLCPSKGINGKTLAAQFQRWERERKWRKPLWNSVILNSNIQENTVSAQTSAFCQPLQTGKGSEIKSFSLFAEMQELWGNI